jgi:exopolysaccharide biosynthesis polyprenyl glycosylphosphotransferase
MFTRHRRILEVLFGLADVSLVAASFEAAYRTRLWVNLGELAHPIFFFTPPVKVLLLGFSALTWLAAGHWFDVYDKLDSAHPRVILRDTFRQCLFGAFALVLFQYSLRLDVSRPFIAFFAAYAWILLCLFRLNAGSLVGLARRRFGALHHVLVIGLGEGARRVGRQLQRSERYGVRVAAFLAGDTTAAELRAILHSRVIDEVIFAVDAGRLAALEEVARLCGQEGVRTRVLLDFFPYISTGLYLDRLGPEPLLTFSAAPHDEIRLLVKRVIDVVLASLALLLLWPFLLLIALLVRASSPGPALFRQIRCGLNGRRFVFYKFRSMRHNAEALRAGVAHLSTRAVATKIPNDPRLTPLGAWLRKFSLDELPQLWNVLKGDMSLVGPRPAVPEEVEQYQQWQRRRLRMRPGLTCLWALAGRDAVDFDTWMKMDMHYIDNWSLSLDWKILLLTIPRVLTGAGAH